jgi:replicative DNA helicase
VRAAPQLVPPPAQRIQPHSLEAEKSALGSVFIKPAAFEEIAAELQVDDFFQPAHREIFDAMLAIARRREPIDVLTVGDELKTRGMLARLEGGESYLLALANVTPTAENAAHYARRVKEKATLRHLIATAAEIGSSAYGDFGDFDLFLQEAEGKIAAVAQRAAARAWLSTVERALALGGGRPPLATGFRTLDADTRGGLRPGVVVIGGAPGVGKTICLVQLALRWALLGIHVSILAADEEPSGLLIRVGQGLGLSREDLEDGRPEARARFVELLGEIPTLKLVDGAEATVEAAAHELRKRAADGPAVLCIDSVQTVRASGSAEADGPRARIDAVVAALKSAGRSGLMVVASCELARSAYRSKNTADRAEALAAFKESGAIEYAAHLAIVMTSVKGEIGTVDVETVKNRWGSGKTPMRLVQNFATASFSETAGLDSATLMQSDVTAARAALRSKPGVTGKWALAALIEGRMSKSRKEDAISALMAAGEIENRGTSTRPRWFHADKASSPELPGTPRGRNGQHSSPAPRANIGRGAGGGSFAGSGELAFGDAARGELE